MVGNNQSTGYPTGYNTMPVTTFFTQQYSYPSGYTWTYSSGNPLIPITGMWTVDICVAVTSSQSSDMTNMLVNSGSTGLGQAKAFLGNSGQYTFLSFHRTFYMTAGSNVYFQIANDYNSGTLQAYSSTYFALHLASAS